MGSKKKEPVKKSVTFSDDATLTRHNHKKKNIDHDTPPVYVRRTIRTVPWHLLLLLYYFLKISHNYDIVGLLYTLIPLQVAYLSFQFNRSTVYGNKIIKINLPLVFIALAASVALAIPTMAMIILLGAPLLTKTKETWLLSLQCCFLSYPAVYSVFNCDFKVGMWKKYFIMIVVGAWISCVVLPLDWDRDWQAWPVPIVVGSYLGAFIGYTIASYI